MVGVLRARAGMVAIVALLLAPGSAHAQWGVVGTPAPRTEVGAMLSGTACSSARDCWAVGTSSNGMSNVSLVEHWDGASWTPVETPAPPAADMVLYGLNGVTCGAADACWAVGSYYAGAGSTRPLIERWDGRSWSLVGAPGTGDADVLLGATCTSPSDCWAVGYSFRMGWQSLIEHWDGSAWTRVDSPDPFGGDTLAPPFNVLRSVACRSAADCWAAGYGKQGADYRALLAHWDGRRWSASTPAAATGASDAALYGVACAPSTCWAAGLSGGPGEPTSSSTDPSIADPQPLLERLDAGGVSVATPALAAGAGQAGLAGVACGGSNGCVAVGYTKGAADGSYRSLIQRWDGTTWRASTSADPAGAAQTTLSAVSCAAADACVTAGTSINELDVFQPLVESSAGGGWRTTLSDFTEDASAVFRGVACPEASQCWAVGYDEARVRTLVSRWDGERWAVVASPNDPSATAEGLYGVTCQAAADCWAVGWQARNGGFTGLAQHWDGARWTRVDAGVLAVDHYLYGVACAAPDECWAVGATIVGEDSTQPLIERWDGRMWTVAPNATPTQADGYLAGVTCAGRADCWAVGGTPDHPLVEHFNGVAWTIADIAPTLSAGLEAVTCASASDCWAVGGGPRVLAEHWNGSSWSRAASPDAAGQLDGVACRSSSRCWAVGARVDGSTLRTIIEGWDGNAWTAADPPPLGTATRGDTLIGVTCPRGGAACWAAGSWADAHQLHTLAEHEPAAAPTAAPSSAPATSRVVARQTVRGHRASCARVRHTRRARHRARHRHRHARASKRRARRSCVRPRHHRTHHSRAQRRQVPPTAAKVAFAPAGRPAAAAASSAPRPPTATPDAR